MTKNARRRPAPKPDTDETPMAANASISSTRRCATARRPPASISRSTTSGRSRPARSRSASITSRAAIPAPIRSTPIFSDEAHRSAARFAAFGMTKRAGRSAANDPGVAGSARRRRRRHRLRRQVLGLSCARRARLHAGGKSRRHRRQRRGGGRGRAARRSSIASISSTASRPIPTTRSPAPRPPIEAGARWIVLCDTNGGTLPHEVERIVARGRGAACPATISASMPITTPNKRSPIRSPPCAPARGRSRAR